MVSASVWVDLPAQRIQVYLPDDVARKLRTFCQSRNITMGSFLQRAVIELLNECGGVE